MHNQASTFHFSILSNCCYFRRFFGRLCVSSFHFWKWKKTESRLDNISRNNHSSDSTLDEHNSLWFIDYLSRRPEVWIIPVIEMKKTLVLGEDWGQEEKEATEDKMVGWHHWLNGHEFKQIQEVVKIREAWHAAVHGVAKRHDSDWTITGDEETVKTGHLPKVTEPAGDRSTAKADNDLSDPV